jgi:hypothetical protein
LRFIHSRQSPINAKQFASPDSTIYFLANLTGNVDSLNITFRQTGKTPQLWNPADGSITDFPVYVDNGGQITLPLHFNPHESIFVVFQEKKQESHIVSIKKSGESIFPQLPFILFRDPYFIINNENRAVFQTAGTYEIVYDNGKSKKFNIDAVKSLTVLSPWKVAFDPEWGGPVETVFDRGTS